MQATDPLKITKKVKKFVIFKRVKKVNAILTHKLN